MDEKKCCVQWATWRRFGLVLPQVAAKCFEQHRIWHIRLERLFDWICVDLFTMVHLKITAFDDCLHIGLLGLDCGAALNVSRLLANLIRSRRVFFVWNTC